RGVASRRAPGLLAHSGQLVQRFEAPLVEVPKHRPRSSFHDGCRHETRMFVVARSRAHLSSAMDRATLSVLAIALLGASCAPRDGGVVEVSAAATITATRASNDDATVSYAISYSGTHSFFRVYLDADQRTATGFAVGGVGAEILIENGFRYRYTGTGTSWSWT